MSLATRIAQELNTIRGEVGTHESDVANPHSVTKVQVGLGNVDNTSDMNKPVSTAQGLSISTKSAISDIKNNLISTDTDKPLSANQGKVLKGLIDTIETTLLSDNANLDSFQEVVDFIEQNKEDLDTLTISNIAGLQSALNGKVDDSQVLTNVPAGAVFTDTLYTHPSHPGDDINVDTGALSGATVISDLDFNVTTDTLGHVTDANATISTRNITLGDLGFTGDSNANNYTHPSTHPATMITTTDEFTHSDSTNVQDVLDDLDQAIANVNAKDPVITLSGDVTGSGTMTNLGNVSINATVANDSHSHSNYVSKTGDTMTGTLTVPNLTIGSGNKIKFANNDYIRYDDANGVGRYHFDSDGGTNNASVQAATFVGALSGNATSATTASNANLLDNLDSNSFLRSDATDYLTATLYTRGDLVSGENGYRNRGMFGVYDSYKTAPIWSMGTGYRNHADGTNFGNLYGLAYKHTNNSTGGTMAGGHQMVWCQNGVPRAAMGDSIWTSGNVTAYSDRRVKENLEVIPDALDRISKLNGYTYDRTDIVTNDIETEYRSLHNPNNRHVGLIAQELLKVLPEAVIGGPTDKEGTEDEHYSVAYGNVVALLIEGIKEQTERIELLEKKINHLEVGA